MVKDYRMFCACVCVNVFRLVSLSLHEARLPFTWGNEATLSKTFTSACLPPTSHFLLKRTIQLGSGRATLHSLRPNIRCTVSFALKLVYTTAHCNSWAALWKKRSSSIPYNSVAVSHVLFFTEWPWDASASSDWMRSLLGSLSASCCRTSTNTSAIWLHRPPFPHLGALWA